jgi:ABC-type transporter Mla MlaB component
MESRTVTLDCTALAGADAELLDGLARLCLLLQRRGCTLRLRNPGAALLELIEFAGLAAVLRVEAGGKAEQREETGRVQEEGQLGDLPV